MKAIYWSSLLLVMGTALAGCSCGGDDDDDDSGDDGGEESAWTAADCQQACDNVFGCGGVVWYETKDECQQSCAEWLDVAADCADCVLNCWVAMEGCVAAGLCMTDCAYGACVDMFDEYV